MNSLQNRGPQVGRKTDVGRVRSANEDCMGDLPVENGHVLIVADGMGGYRGGAIASGLVVEAIEEYFLDTELENPQKALKESIYTANERIYLRGKQDEDLSRMGSTCVLALVQKNKLYLAHVGDSRIYLLRPGGTLQRLTRDHTVVQHFVDVGLLSEEEAEGHPDSHILSRALGPRAHVEPEIQENPITLKEGDRVLLCSDGLTKMLTEKNIGDYMALSTSIQEIAEQMVDLANDNGGEDNVTVLAYEYHPAEGEEETSSDDGIPVSDLDFSDDTPPLALGLEGLKKQAESQNDKSTKSQNEIAETKPATPTNQATESEEKKTSTASSNQTPKTDVAEKSASSTTPPSKD